jgi:hypothetical protein
MLHNGPPWKHIDIIKLTNFPELIESSGISRSPSSNRVDERGLSIFSAIL